MNTHKESDDGIVTPKIACPASHLGLVAGAFASIGSTVVQGMYSPSMAGAIGTPGVEQSCSVTPFVGTDVRCGQGVGDMKEDGTAVETPVEWGIGDRRSDRRESQRKLASLGIDLIEDERTGKKEEKERRRGKANAVSLHRSFPILSSPSHPLSFTDKMQEAGEGVINSAIHFRIISAPTLSFNRHPYNHPVQ